MKNIDKLLSEIAKRELGIDTLETQNSDSLDCSVWSIKDALKAAYEAGKQEAKGEVK